MTIVTIAAIAIGLAIPPTYAYVNFRRASPSGRRKTAKTRHIDAAIAFIIGWIAGGIFRQRYLPLGTATATS